MIERLRERYRKKPPAEEPPDPRSVERRDRAPYTRMRETRNRPPFPFYLPLAVAALVGAVPAFALLVVNGIRLRCPHMKRTVAIATVALACGAATHLAYGHVDTRALAERWGAGSELAEGLTRLALSLIALAAAMVVTVYHLDAFRFAAGDPRFRGPPRFLYRFLALGFGYCVLVMILKNGADSALAKTAFALLLTRAA